MRGDGDNTEAFEDSFGRFTKSVHPARSLQCLLMLPYGDGPPNGR
ncbi:hypothetical protein FHT87_006142 [Rhizobium sp. BK316]|nr:hypothetical protein [Rhizobium sp. BK316]